MDLENNILEVREKFISWPTINPKVNLEEHFSICNFHQTFTVNQRELSLTLTL